ncbi:MAG: glycoside hydrolase family 9 protein [Anaerolinea sp.]|nr:glycoside hydrolase family 9 protein [Anaerolinea sp.]
MLESYPQNRFFNRRLSSMRRGLLGGLLALLILVTGTAPTSLSQGTLAPPPVPGEAYYIAFPVSITLDGKIDDWAGVPTDTFTRGSIPPTSPDKAGRMTFALASDGTYLYAYLHITDDDIIAGKHGGDYWNEDSVELYINTTGDNDRRDYVPGTVQINFNTANIGMTPYDPTKIVKTGVNAASTQTSAYIWQTDDGYAVEAAILLDGEPFNFKPAHGTVIGLQVHGNGASTADRDLKVIWSNLDKSDNSWQDPSLFGLGIFFEVGKTDVPTIPKREVKAIVTPVPAPTVGAALNQIGYLPNAPKLIMVAEPANAAANYKAAWAVINAKTGELAASGYTGTSVFDPVSGDKVLVADFSHVTTPGEYRLLVTGGPSEGVQIKIASDLYASLAVDSLRYFYLNRSGIELTPEFAGEWARAAGHLTDSSVTCFKGTDVSGKAWEGCDYMLDGSKGWYDAGDYGKYVVNGGISVWTLLNAYERHPGYFADSSLNIPEGGNGVPDILDEARWEIEFLLNMQIPEGKPLAGMVFHKLHDRKWAGLPILPPTEFDNNAVTGGRYVYQPTTAATLNLAAVAAQCARIWKDIDASFSARCLKVATTAWAAAQAHPDMLAGSVPGEGGGDYGDGEVRDEFFWAAAELYLTTGEMAYLDVVHGSPYFETFFGLLPDKASAMYWGDTAALGSISLITVKAALSEADLTRLRTQITQTADLYLARMNAGGYRVSFGDKGYVWGSSSVILNNALVMAYAHDFTAKPEYLHGVIESMDYLLGRNALNKSLISGYGLNGPLHVHHRFWGNQPDQGFPPPPPGALAGGPNETSSDPGATEANLSEQPIAKRYVDDIDSYSTNEVAINWNAPLAWVATYLDQMRQER